PPTTPRSTLSPYATLSRSRAHPAAPQQLLEAGAQQLPVVVVSFAAIRAVHDDSPDAARLQQRLVDRQVGQVRQQLGAFLLPERRIDGVVIPELHARIVRVTRERVWGHRIVRHGPHRTGWVWCQ